MKINPWKLFKIKFTSLEFWKSSLLSTKEKLSKGKKPINMKNLNAINYFYSAFPKIFHSKSFSRQLCLNNIIGNCDNASIFGRLLVQIVHREDNGFSLIPQNPQNQISSRSTDKKNLRTVFSWTMSKFLIFKQWHQKCLFSKQKTFCLQTSMALPYKFLFV